MRTYRFIADSVLVKPSSGRAAAAAASSGSSRSSRTSTAAAAAKTFSAEYFERKANLGLNIIFGFVVFS